MNEPGCKEWHPWQGVKHTDGHKQALPFVFVSSDVTKAVIKVIYGVEPYARDTLDVGCILTCCPRNLELIFSLVPNGAATQFSVYCLLLFIWVKFITPNVNPSLWGFIAGSRLIRHTMVIAGLPQRICEKVKGQDSDWLKTRGKKIGGKVSGSRKSKRTVGLEVMHHFRDYSDLLSDRRHFQVGESLFSFSGFPIFLFEKYRVSTHFWDWR